MTLAWKGVTTDKCHPLLSFVYGWLFLLLTYLFLAFPIQEIFLEKVAFWDFPGGPVIRTRCFHCGGPGFNPWPGRELRSRKPRGTAKKKKFHSLVWMYHTLVHQASLSLNAHQNGGRGEACPLFWKKQITVVVVVVGITVQALSCDRHCALLYIFIEFYDVGIYFLHVLYEMQSG